MREVKQVDSIGRSYALINDGSMRLINIGLVVLCMASLHTPTIRAFVSETGLHSVGKTGITGTKTRQATENNADESQYPILAKGEDIMSPKSHGTSDKPVQKELLYGMDFETADRICNFNRRYAEYKGYATNFLNFLERKSQEDEASATTKFYDSVTGNLLFTAPIGRTVQEFVAESKEHGWPSFRDEEVNWEYVRCLEGFEEECVSKTGTHLGHNIPDEKGNRYCINLVSIAGRPPGSEINIQPR